MRKNLVSIVAITILSLTSCYVTVREEHPHPHGRVIIQSSDIASPKDSLGSPVSGKMAVIDSLQAPGITEPVKK